MQSTSSHPATDDSTIIRAGSDGRLRYSPDQKQSLLAAFDRSGISAMAFARQHGIQYQTFIVWLRKRREQGPTPALDSAAGASGFAVCPGDDAMLPAALNVLDRFHIAKKLGEAIDEIRRQEVKQLADKGYEPVLKNSRYCFLKRKANLTIRQATKLRDLLKYDLKSMRALALKESFDAFWQYESPRWAGWFLKKWCTRAMRSKLAPMKKFVDTLRNHEDLLMNYFKAGKLYSSGIVEGLNLRINLCMRKAYGYRSFDLLQISLYHTLGDLPEPKFTHRFC